jgi:hypothetical protein
MVVSDGGLLSHAFVALNGTGRGHEEYLLT